ncbi:MAG: PEP-CTERM sorting domain-containing protein [Spirochaetales bacterium]|jgi:hypothetical protein|nr:PEP-CTERM sorting domain-containing protein [Spirochaetales bacterium]
MKTTKMTVCLFALAASVANETQASLIPNWSWTMTPSVIEVTPMETISIFGEVSNDSSSSEILNVGSLAVAVVPEWDNYYVLTGDPIDITLAPGESTTFLLGTLTPKTEVPAGHEFTFKSGLAAMYTTDPIDWKSPTENLSVSVIPEPSSVALLLIGGMGVWMARRKRIPR